MYKPRIADKLLVRKLAGKGAVLIEGPKWCGKTTTARQQAKSLLDLGDTEVLKQSRQMMEISSKTLLQGDTPRLIDEWQTIPELWDTIRNEVDKRGFPYKMPVGLYGLHQDRTFFFSHCKFTTLYFSLQAF